MDKAALAAEAARILRANDRGGYTVPSATLYPHQWNWDSAFSAIGWATIDPRRAARELAMLARGQWQDGLIPHILFNPAAEHYQPGPAAWKTIGVRGAPEAVRTSSITQPPVAASAARIVLERSGGDREVEATLRALVAPLERWHEWFAATRDPRGEGTVAIVHPWESGMDNAPRWDRALARIDPGHVEYQRVDDQIVDAKERPTKAEYDRYFFLVVERARRGFAPPRLDEPFLVADVVMTALLARAEADLDALARALGEPAGSAGARCERWLGGLARLDGERGYRDRDLVSGEVIDVAHVASLVPIYAPLPEPAARRVIDRVTSGEWDAPWPLPTVPLGDARFDARRYWRGPCWINVNWLVIDGLRHSGQTDAAARLAERTLELVALSGFREYYHPETGEGLGAREFGWTAALVLDLLAAL